MDSYRISRVPHYSGVHIKIQQPFAYETFTLCGSSFQRDSAWFLNSTAVVLQPHECRNKHGLGSPAFARHYLRNHFYFLLLQVLRCFSSLRSPPIKRMLSLQDNGLSHWEIFGSKVICTYPKLIAAYHVLLRLREPRHPPCALFYLFSTIARFSIKPGGLHRKGLIYTISSFLLFPHLYTLFA